MDGSDRLSVRFGLSRALLYQVVTKYIKANDNVTLLLGSLAFKKFVNLETSNCDDKNIQ